ncbi:WUSCHEL-related homeobox 11 [Syzygium oleosum]|uniref:WUSCHEL-related homeobox 11 n=1 Tax=Syzygium oleosum TaxID=219896 RepID=UPI0011D21AF5|nr:WUSCHEL-related homeobox 11 [Syzygium oleosum]
MEDQSQDPNGSTSHGHERGGGEPVRSRWTPKPEQILILESIFNSGMVNPPKDETVRIRKLLEKFGAVGDANVFYWFQNRRSRSRRRQRQMQAASLAAAAAAAEQRNNNDQGQQAEGAIHHQCYDGSSSSDMGLASFGSSCSSYSNYSAYGSESSSSSCGVMSQEAGDSFFPSLMGHHHVGFPESDQNCTTGLTSSILCQPEAPNMHYQQSGIITVFINGIPTEIPRGPLDMKSVFGQDAILVHSSGLPVPTNEYGHLMQSLEHGESYFLVSRPT